MKKVGLTLFLICGIILSACGGDFSIPPKVIPGRSSPNILDYGVHYWRSIPDWESKRIFLEGYLLGVTSGIFQIALGEQKEYGDFQYAHVNGIGAGYLVYLMDNFYSDSENQEAPVLNAVYRVIQEERRKQNARPQN